MDFFIDFTPEKLSIPIKITDKILLTGSCFTEHIGNALAEHKFTILQNPCGTLFNPQSVRKSLQSYMYNNLADEDELFQWQEIWSSWQHHSSLSSTDKGELIRNINEAHNKAHHFLKKADWLIITLGSAFQYQLLPDAPENRTERLRGVANCHRTPGNWFNKKLLSIEEIIGHLDNMYHELRNFNPDLKLLFTISPVRHIRDGVVENNRSKARLIEAVQHIVHKFNDVFYFPAYELLIDVLRDYRFYDVDLVHPNYAATSFVLEQFMASSMEEDTRQLLQSLKKIAIAMKHKPFHPDTVAHRQFLKAHFLKVQVLQKEYPTLDFTKELTYFSEGEL